MDWNGSSVKPPLFEDEGALHIGKGRFLLSMSNGEAKEMSGWRRWVLIIAAVVIVIATVVYATFLIGHQRNSIPHKWHLERSFGCSLAVISNELDIPISDWIDQGNGVYELKKPCKASGISYKLRLHFDTAGRMNGLAYTADYKAGKNKAASDIYKAADDLGLDGYDAETDSYVDLTKSYLKKYFRNNKVLDVRFTHQYARKKNELDTNESYLRIVESEPGWEGLVHGYLTNPARIYETRSIEYTPETERVLIHIIYQIEPQRES